MILSTYQGKISELAFISLLVNVSTLLTSKRQMVFWTFLRIEEGRLEHD